MTTYLLNSLDKKGDYIGFRELTEQSTVRVVSSLGTMHARTGTREHQLLLRTYNKYMK